MEQRKRLHSRSKRFIKVSARETVRRLCEMILQCLAFSMIGVVVEDFDFWVSTKLYPVMKIFLFLAFQLCTLRLCRKSIRRVYYYGRYYTANCIAYILFCVLCIAPLFLIDLYLYLKVFRVTLSLVLTQSFTLSHMFLSLLAFYVLTFIMILLFPVGEGLYIRLRKKS